MPTLAVFALAAKWYVIAKTLAGFGRVLLRLEKTCDARAWPLANWLETASRAALAELLSAIHYTPVLTEDEVRAQRRLLAFATAIWMLAMLAQKIRRALARRSPAGYRFPDRVRRPCDGALPFPRGLLFDVAFLDSS